MPWLLKPMRDSKYYKHPLQARSPVHDSVTAVRSSQDAAVIALMVVFFALLGIAIVLIAVYWSKRKRDKDVEQEDQIRLVPLRSHKTRSTASSQTKEAGSLFGNVDSPGFSATPLQAGGSSTPDRRGRLELPESGTKIKEVQESVMPQYPPPTYRSEPREVFPGVVKYGMGQIGNDGKVHRPESIFKHLEP